MKLPPPPCAVLLVQYNIIPDYWLGSGIPGETNVAIWKSANKTEAIASSGLKQGNMCNMRLYVPTGLVGCENGSFRTGMPS